MIDFRCESCGDNPGIDPIPSFRWESFDANTRRAKLRPLTHRLYAGKIELAMVSPSATGKRYVVDCWMPQAGARSYHPEDKAKEVAEVMCRRWFEACYAESEYTDAGRLPRTCKGCTEVEDTNMTQEWVERAWKNNPCAKLSNGDVRTGPVRLSFPHLLTLPKARNDIEPKFGASLLFPSDVDIAVLRKEAADCAKAKWADKLPRKLKSPFLDQTDDADRYAGFLEGGVLIRASANQKISVVDSRLAPVIDEDKIYPGVWAICTIRAFAYDKGVNQGVSFGLQNVMIIADDTNIGGTAAANPRDAFAGVNIEAGDINADKAFGEGSVNEPKGEVDIFS